jgi:aminotransferase
VFPRIVPEGLTSMDLALRLLYEAKLITVPGSAFGPTGEGHIRLSFGATEEDLHRAFDRMEAWAECYR